ncbi:MAG: 3',5'-cyclic adenosine monophosphate phosphodiesterase CpdA [Haliscomenobacter sp.]|nr:3',5'-cyclic adenosine monophosphate phosphodiesterase CpdA [Haliscomenobacter sp.]
MRIWFFIGFLLAIDAYSFQALRLWTQSWPSSAKYAVNLLFWAIPAFAIGLTLASLNGLTDHWNKNFLTYARTGIFIIYLSKFVVLPFLAIDDLRRGFQWIIEKTWRPTGFSLSRSRFLSNVGLALGSIPFFSLTYGMIRNPYRYKLFQTTIEFDDLPHQLDGLRIVQISDIHSGSFMFKEPVKAAIDLINEQRADLVFFTGDLVNDKATEMRPYMDVFDKIQAKHGVYSVLGNHDYGDYAEWESEQAKEANLDELKAIHRRLGWNLLLNEHRLLDVNGAQLAILGVENHSAHLRFPRRGDLAAAIQGAEGAAFKVLLSHDPSHWDMEVNKQFNDIHLTLSGHTHGMQFGIEIPGWIKWSPIKYMYKQWAGLYQNGAQYLYVNRGLGFLGYPGRVGILPEVACIELRKKSAASLS